MSVKTIKLTKYNLIIIGAILMLISSRLVVVSMDISNPLLPQYLRKEYTGTEVPLWSLVVVGGALLFLLSYFRNSLFFKIAYYAVLAIVLFLVIVFSMTFSRDTNGYTNNLEYGFYIQQIGFGLLAIGTIISLHRPHVKKDGAYADLLDS